LKIHKLNYMIMYLYWVIINVNKFNRRIIFGLNCMYFHKGDNLIRGDIIL